MANVRISDLTAGTPPYSPSSLLELSSPSGSPSGFDSRKALLSDIRGTPGADFAWPLPTIDLNLAAESYPVTCTRASVGYVNDSSGTWTSVPANRLRNYPYTDLGALVEEARTNGVRNNSLQGAVAGSPGTLPTNWAESGGTSLTRTLGTPTTSLGVDVMTFRENGTSGATFSSFFVDTTTAIAATNGQVWTVSAFIALTAGALTNISAILFVFNCLDSGGALLTQQTGSDFKGSLTSALQRFTGTFTTNHASTAFVRLSITLTYSSGVAIDYTLLIGWPQVELGSWASSPIRTTSAAATRAADVVSLNLPPAFGSAVTVASAGAPQAPAAYTQNQTLVQVDDGTNNNRILLYRENASSNSGGVVSSGGGTSASFLTVAWTVAAAGIVALSSAANDFAFSFNGTAVSADTSGAAPVSMTAVHLGCGPAGGAQWNGFITRVMIWNNEALGDQLVQDAAGSLPEWDRYTTLFQNIDAMVTSDYNGSGLLPPSKATAGWAIGSNYSGLGEVDLWSLVTGNSKGFSFLQMTADGAASTLARIYGDGTFSDLDLFVGGTATAFLFADATGVYFGSNVATPFFLQVNNATKAEIYANGDFRAGTGVALATNVTGGFFSIPCCAGAPTGVPANAGTGEKQMIYDSTNNNFYVYNGAWKKVALT